MQLFIGTMQGYTKFPRLSTIETVHGTFKRRVTCGSSRRLIVYTKPDCPLCDGLKDKVSGLIARAQFMPSILTEYSLEIRDVSEREEWSNAYAGEVPVLAVERDGVQVTLPRPPPRITADRLQQHIEKALQ